MIQPSTTKTSNVLNRWRALSPRAQTMLSMLGAQFILFWSSGPILDLLQSEFPLVQRIQGILLWVVIPMGGIYFYLHTSTGSFSQKASNSALLLVIYAIGFFVESFLWIIHGLGQGSFL